MRRGHSKTIAVAPPSTAVPPPPAWTQAKGAQLFTVIRGVTYKKQDASAEAGKGKIAILRAGNIQNGGLLFDDLVFVPANNVADTQKLRKGDLVVAMSSGSRSIVGKVGLAAQTDDATSFGAFCGVIRASLPELSPWLYHFFQTPEYRRHISEQSAGVNINNLRPSHLLNLDIPLPPLAEQRRIVARLQKLEARSRRARAALDAVPALLAQARQSLLAAAFCGDLTKDWRKKNPQKQSGRHLLSQAHDAHREHWISQQLEALQRSGKKIAGDSWRNKYVPPEAVDAPAPFAIPNTWAWASGAEIVQPGAEIVYGIVQPGPKLEEGVPYVRGMDIENGKILVGQLKNTSQIIANRYARAALRGGDVLLGIIRATKVATVPPELTGANITQGTARFRPCPAITTHYLARALEAPAIQDWLHAHYRGIDMPGLNLKDVRKVPIPLAPLAEQTEIVHRLESGLAHLDTAATAYAEAVAKLDKLDQSLLAQAFRGELVPQDPRDEPAATLFARIAAARKTAVEAQNKSPRKTMAKKQPTTPKRDLIAILADHPEGLSPEQLLTEAGYTYDEIPAFYQQLRTIEKHLHESRPERKQVLLKRRAK